MRIVVLLSTYNGQKYLSKQIDSILKQNVEHLDLLIRDDGSTDDTLSIIERYSEKYDNISYYRGKNKGACQSFFDLIRRVSENYDYYAFSDQDDYWEKDKLDIAVRKLREIDEQIPMLYCSNVIATDEHLHPIGYLFKKNKIEVNFHNAIFENIAVGCSCVTNQKLLSLIKQHIPQRCYMHDWWIYIVATYFGKVIYDNDSYILYRQHSNNVVGASKSILQQYVRRWKNSKSLCHYPSIHMKELSEKYILSKDNDFIQSVIQAPSSIKARLHLARGNSFARSRRVDTIIYKIRIVLYGC